MSQETPGRRQQDVQRLRMLFCQREQKAREAVSEQQLEVQRVEKRLEEQNALISELREQIRLLHQLRAPESASALSAESLIMESTRRHWLSYDLEQEVFYLSGFESDVYDARKELLVRQRTLARARARISGLDELLAETAREHRQMDARREEALQDDRPTRECAHG